jgi:rfaE bifunctional protein kinase chain/domain
LAANISNNLNELGINSTLCGVIGEDKNANIFESLLEENKLKTWGIVRSEDRPTTFKERVTTNTQQICRIDYESRQDIDKNTEDRLLERVEDFTKDHQAIILEDYAKGCMTHRVLQALIKGFKDEGKLVAVDPGRTTPPLFYKGATLLKPNLTEAKLMVQSLGKPSDDLNEIADILVKELDLEKLIITLGGEGMALIDTKGDGKLSIIPTVANKVFDVSGAGDTAISLLTASLIAGASLEEAAWIGNCGAGVVVAKKGTATVGLEELTQFHRRLVEKL